MRSQDDGVSVNCTLKERGSNIIGIHYRAGLEAQPENRRPQRHAVSKEEDDSRLYIELRTTEIYVVIGVKIIKLVVVNPSITLYGV